MPLLGRVGKTLISIAFAITGITAITACGETEGAGAR